jgi:alpha-ketoglutarate-dependent taurine dioxygenase
MNEDSYQQWKKARLENYPRSVEELLVEVSGLVKMSDAEKVEIEARCRRSNMAVYRCRDEFVDRATVRTFASHFGLTRLDHHLCVNADGVSELSVATTGVRSDYVPYSNRSLSWHTDGYYNDASEQVRAVVLHCAETAAAGGENELLDPDIAYILLRDRDPRFITAFEHPECLTIPANRGEQGEIRPAVTGPVFSYNAGVIHMRFSARKKHIQWRDDDITRQARECLAEILADENGPVLRYRLEAGEGLISNNVLHNRTAFEDGGAHQRLLYRARFFDRIETS